MGCIIDREQDRNMEHLTGEHINAVWANAFGNGLVQHAEKGREMRMKRAFGLAGSAAGVKNKKRVFTADSPVGLWLISTGGLNGCIE